MYEGFMVSTLKLEDELIICCARTNIDAQTGNRIKQIINEEMDWEYVLKTASKHRVIPLFYSQINLLCPEDIPEHVMAVLKDQFKSNAYKNMMMLGELLKLLNLFESKGIIVIPYKGPVLAISTYNDIRLRQFVDLDIYVYEKDIPRVNKILLNEGYNPDFQIDESKKVKYNELRRDFSFFSESGVKIEIHKMFQSWVFSLPDDENSFLDKKTALNITRDKIIINPSIENMILILSIHNAGHRWSLLYWICDLAELIKNNEDVNWKYIIEKAEKLVIKRILLINLHLVMDLYDVILPILVNEEFKKDKSIKNLANLFKESLFKKSSKNFTLTDELMISIKIREKFIYGIRDCIKPLFTPTLYELKTLPLPPYLWSFYSIYRPFNLLFRYKLK